MQVTHVRPVCEPDVTIAGKVEANGGAYEFCVWRVGGQWFAAFPDYGRASRVASTADHRPDYVGDKFKVSRPDAEVMTEIINQCIGTHAKAQALADSIRDQFTAPSLGDFLDQVRNG